MDELTVNIRYVLGKREDQGLEQGKIIFNAPRPLYGHRTWTGDFLAGIFYAEIDPAQDYAADYAKRNVELDAKVLKWIDEKTLRESVQSYYDREYPDHDIKVDEYTVNQIWASFFNNIAQKTAIIRLGELK